MVHGCGQFLKNFFLCHCALLCLCAGTGLAAQIVLSAPVAPAQSPSCPLVLPFCYCGPAFTGIAGICQLSSVKTLQQALRLYSSVLYKTPMFINRDEKCGWVHFNSFFCTCQSVCICEPCVFTGLQSPCIAEDHLLVQMKVCTLTEICNTVWLSSQLLLSLLHIII